MDMLRGADMGVVGVVPGDDVDSLARTSECRSGSLSGLRTLLLLVPLVEVLLLPVLLSMDIIARLGTEPPGLDAMDAGEMGDGQSRSE